LPPQVLKTLTAIRAEKYGVAIDDWGRERLWQIVKAFPNSLASTLPFGSAHDTTAAEIKVLLRFLTQNRSCGYR
jgi:hypothetical protein